MAQEQRFQDIVADEVLKAFGLDSAPKPSDPGFWQKHCDRYHPEGFKEGSSCKYLDDVKGNKPQEESTIERIERQEQSIRNKYGVFCHRPQNDMDLEYLNLPTYNTKLLKGGRFFSDVEYEQSLSRFENVMKDLKERFPSLRPGFDFVYFYDTTSSGAAGKGTYDRRSGIGYIFLGLANEIKKFETYNYNHADDRLMNDVIRHEIGHSLSTNHIRQEFEKFVSDDKIESYGRDRLIVDMAKSVSLSAALFLVEKDENKRNKLKEECIAELFSVYTDPEYDGHNFPLNLGLFVKEMIENPQTPPQIEVLTMDEKESKNKIKRPYYIKDLEFVDPLPITDKSRSFPSYEWMENRMVYHNSQEEKEKHDKEYEEKVAQKTASPEEAREWIKVMAIAMKSQCLKSKRWKDISPRIQDEVAKSFLEQYNK